MSPNNGFVGHEGFGFESGCFTVENGLRQRIGGGSWEGVGSSVCRLDVRGTA